MHDNFWLLIDCKTSYFLLIFSLAENETKSLQECHSMKNQDILVPIAQNSGPIIEVFGKITKKYISLIPIERQQ